MLQSAERRTECQRQGQEMAQPLGGDQIPLGSSEPVHKDRQEEYSKEWGNYWLGG
jgi:hypothetical protein